ncbi:MAG: M56 family metallopeptidase [Rhodanobacter sp.]
MNFFTLAYLARLEVWMLLAVALQGGLVLMSWLLWERAMGRATADVRYRVACTHLVVLLTLPTLTMAILHWTIAGMGVPPASGSPVARLSSLMADNREWLRLCVLLTSLWLTGASVMLLRLIRDVYQLARLQHVPAPTILAKTVQRLARERLGMHAPTVHVADIPAPRIVGWRRPVLLTPRDLALRLSNAESEAVLLHELAHVQRGDFGWNLIQRMVLALLWFQPAAWSLYRHLARERELCCDAFAVRHGASPTSLARALVHLAAKPARSGLSMAITGRGELTTRVHRLLGLDPKEPPPARLRMVAVVVSFLCLMALGGGRLGRADPSMADVYNASIFGAAMVVDAHDDAGSFALLIRQGRILAASVGKQSLPRDRILQQGDRVTLMDTLRRPILALTVTPQGRIEWTARR